jgi:diguanylate cyclase (GGDEF)-like protein
VSGTSIDLSEGAPTVRRDRRNSPDAGRGVRQAGVLFAAVGVIGLVSDLLPWGVGHGHEASTILDAVNLLVGIAVIAFSRVPLLHGWVGLVLPVFALANVAANNAAGVLPPATYGTWFVLIMVWVGIWYPPWTVIALSPVMGCAYLLPFLVGAPRSPGAVAAVLLVVPAAVLAGETIAHFTDKVRRAEVARESLLSELSRENATDPLTGVGNRRLGELLLDSLEPGDAVAILDVDHFKQVNDAHGHVEGDRLLHSLGAHLITSMRENDAVARMGGDEFMVVMRGVGPDGINTVSRLVDAWRQNSPLATISAGVAVHRSKTRPQDTYAAADGALYEAKCVGRSRAVLAREAGKAA